MEHEINHDMLNIKDPVVIDNSIESYELEEFLPPTKSNFNQSGQTIQIDVQAIDGCYRPSHSYIHLEGYLSQTNNNNDRYAENSQIALINNAMMYLFTTIEYSIGGKVMETLTHPGQTTSMFGYLVYPDDFNTSTGLLQCWSKDTTNNADSSKYNRLPRNQIAAGTAIDVGALTPTENPNYNQGFATRRALLMTGDDNTRGNFSFDIPFSHIFGFSEYDKVMYNVKHTLKLIRSGNHLAIHKANNIQNDGKITLTDITWCIPNIVLSPESRSQLMKGVEQKDSYPIHFSGRNDEHITLPRGVQNFDWRLSVTSGIEKPRWIIVGFQTDKNTNQTQNPAVFDNLDLDRAFVKLNNSRYPKNDTVVNFSNNQYSKYYKIIDDFKREYYGINNLIGGSQINLATYKSLFPLLVFDVKNQSEQLKSGVLDILIKFYFRTGVPENTEAFAVIISDRLFKLSSDGLNMKMINY